MIPKELEELVWHFEGLHKLKAGVVWPYLCPAGYWTQGRGLLVEGPEAPPISPEEADNRARARLPYYLKQALTLCPRLWLAPSGMQAAIADFVFNLGVGRLRASTLRKRINAGDWLGAEEELRKWTYGGGKKLVGLVLRREAEIKLIKQGVEWTS